MKITRKGILISAVLATIGFHITWTINEFNKIEIMLAPAYKLERASLTENSPPSLHTYYLIEKFSKVYHIPKHIAYNIAFKETSYKGPYDWKYNPFLSSSGGAVGAMQIKPATANYINDTIVKRSVLKNNLEYNILTSMKLLSFLYKQYKDWTIVCGCYNTGSPIVNEYARFCATNKNYQKRWVNYEN
jgi:soluble lytic murein transglycosylase-like protein